MPGVALKTWGLLRRYVWTDEYVSVQVAIAI